MPETHYDEPDLIDDLDPTAATDEYEDECELFDVQAWADAYRADMEAQAEHGRFPGVPF